MSRPPLVLSISILCLLLTACPEAPFPLPAEREKLEEMRFFGAPPEDPTNRYLHDPGARALGEQLFADASLSGCGTVSCKSCHEPDQGFSYTLGAGAPGCGGSDTPRNPPSLLNAPYGTWFMWDGSFDRLWSQAIGPFLNPGEMAGTPAALREKLSAPPYADAYAEVFGSGAEAHSEERVLSNFGKALQAFEWTLARRSAPFDRELLSYLAAVDAGTQEEHPLHLGLKTFVRKGDCATCHKGPTLTDEDFHNVGVQDPTEGRTGRLIGVEALLASPFTAGGEYSDQQSGAEAFAANRVANLRLTFADPARRAELEALGQLTGAYKTPSLRNVALTGPYMHTGALNTLEEVVDFYDRGGDPANSFAGTLAPTIKKLELTPEEKASLVTLLELMTGDVP